MTKSYLNIQALISMVMSTIQITALMEDARSMFYFMELPWELNLLETASSEELDGFNMQHPTI